MQLCHLTVSSCFWVLGAHKEQKQISLTREPVQGQRSAQSACLLTRRSYRSGLGGPWGVWGGPGGVLGGSGGALGGPTIIEKQMLFIAKTWPRWRQPLAPAPACGTWFQSSFAAASAPSAWMPGWLCILGGSTQKRKQYIIYCFLFFRGPVHVQWFLSNILQLRQARCTY